MSSFEECRWEWVCVVLPKDVTISGELIVWKNEVRHFGSGCCTIKDCWLTKYLCAKMKNEMTTEDYWLWGEILKMSVKCLCEQFQRKQMRVGISCIDKRCNYKRRVAGLMFETFIQVCCKVKDLCNTKWEKKCFIKTFWSIEVFKCKWKIRSSLTER